MECRVLALACALACAPAAAAPPHNQDGTEILYHFKGGKDGGGPFGGLVRDKQGNLYGATVAGGKSDCTSPIGAPGCGVVFQLSPPASGKGPWDETVLYRFIGGKDGNGPFGTLVRDPKGNLFGTTQQGGAGTAGCPAGCGTVFEISPPTGKNGAWTETVLHKFGEPATDGELPSANLVQDANGNLFGAAMAGGANFLGTVYEMSPGAGGKWSETILHDFRAEDGSIPFAGLLLRADGTLFGTTESGRQGGELCQALGACGTIYSLAPPEAGKNKWPFTVLYRFPGDGRDGFYPKGDLVEDSDGNLIGTASNFGMSHGQQANGTVFRLSPPGKAGEPWALHTLLFFLDLGAYPQSGVLQGRHHVLYGTTSQAGAGVKGNGLVYALSPKSPGSDSWKETPLFKFANAKDGASPVAGVIEDDQGRLYGTASTSGSPNCSTTFCGSVYRVTLQ